MHRGHGGYAGGSQARLCRQHFLSSHGRRQGQRLQGERESVTPGGSGDHWPQHFWHSWPCYVPSTRPQAFQASAPCSSLAGPLWGPADPILQMGKPCLRKTNGTTVPSSGQWVRV